MGGESGDSSGRDWLFGLSEEEEEGEACSDAFGECEKVEVSTSVWRCCCMMTSSFRRR